MRPLRSGLCGAGRGRRGRAARRGQVEDADGERCLPAAPAPGRVTQSSEPARLLLPRRVRVPVPAKPPAQQPSPALPRPPPHQQPVRLPSRRTNRTGWFSARSCAWHCPGSQRGLEAALPNVALLPEGPGLARAVPNSLGSGVSAGHVIGCTLRVFSASFDHPSVSDMGRRVSLLQRRSPFAQRGSRVGLWPNL